MAGIPTNLLPVPAERRSKDIGLLCRRLLCEHNQVSHTVVAQEIIDCYGVMKSAERRAFFEMLCREFSPDEAAVRRAAADYDLAPSTDNLAALSAAVESPRRELFRRIDAAPGGMGTLVALRGHLLEMISSGAAFDPLEADLKCMFQSWFNRGFLRLERITSHTSPLILEKLIRYESVHPINGWADLYRRLESDRRCFAFFHPALTDEPIIFVEVALSNGLAGKVEPLLDVEAPVLESKKADTAIFYSISNCLRGLRNIPFGNFLINEVMAELSAELPSITTYGTLSPLPRFFETLHDQNEDGFTRERLSRLLDDYAGDLTAAAEGRDPVDAFFYLVKDPLSHREVLAAPLQRLAFAYLTQVRRKGKLYDPVAEFHLSNGAHLERINAFGNIRPYGLEASVGVMVNYRYVPSELEENQERFVHGGEIRVSSGLIMENDMVAAAWRGTWG
jgi:malonyl-CoA decarboxylase